MSHSNEIEIRNLSTASLQRSICRKAIRLLEGEAGPTLDRCRSVERLMRMAIALAGAGGVRAPHVKVHNLPSESGPGALPEIFSVDLADLLAARAADHLPAALRGDPEALSALEREGTHLLDTEEIQLG